MVRIKLAGYSTTDVGLESKSAGKILNTLRDKQQSLYWYCASGLAENMRALYKQLRTSESDVTTAKTHHIMQNIPF